MGALALICGGLAGMIRFSAAHKEAEQTLYDAAVAQSATGGLAVA